MWKCWSLELINFLSQEDMQSQSRLNYFETSTYIAILLRSFCRDPSILVKPEHMLLLHIDLEGLLKPNIMLTAAPLALCISCLVSAVVTMSVRQN